MKAWVVFILFAIFVFPLAADQIIVAEDGRRILLKDNGTWEYADIEKVSAGKWVIDEKINPIDDSRQMLFLLVADQGKGIYGDPIVLVIRYTGKDTEIYISWSSYLGSEAYVLTRLGDKAPSTAKWSLSNTSKSTFYPYSKKAHYGFIKELTEVERFIAQVVPYNENPITAIFDVRGLREAITPYNDILNWLE